jgi:hypothetical protein
MADQVDKQRLAGNPYKSIYGSPLQQGKVASMFPDGAQDFGRIYQLEDEMAKTAQEVLGGSQTQPRALADAQFGGGLGEGLLDAGVQYATGGGIPGAVGAARRVIGGNLKDRYNLGMFGTKAKADAIAPTLLDMDPASILRLLDELVAKNAGMQARQDAYGNLGGLLRLPAASAGVGAGGLLGSP